MSGSYYIIALYPSGNEYLVEDGLTFEEASDRQEELNSTSQESILYQLGEGPTGNMKRLDGKKNRRI